MVDDSITESSQLVAKKMLQNFLERPKITIIHTNNTTIILISVRRVLFTISGLIQVFKFNVAADAGLICSPKKVPEVITRCKKIESEKGAKSLIDLRWYV